MAFANIPPVTQDELELFHARHFPDGINNHPPFAALHSVGGHAVDDVTATEETYDEDDLGHYPDGVKRTLTDEQIKIFRHSEIQGLLRDRRRREASPGSDQASFENSSNKPAIQQAVDHKSSTAQSAQNKGGDTMTSETDHTEKPRTNDVAGSQPARSPAVHSSQKTKNFQSQSSAPQYRRRLVSYDD